MALQPLPQIIVSVRDKEGRKNALAVGYAGNVSHDPAMIIIGIEPSRFSHHIVKENGCFVVNLPLKSFRKEFGYLGSKSGRDGDKFEALNLKWADGTMVNAPILLDCPVNIECTVITSILPENGSNELFIGKVETVHVNEEYLSENGNILWNKMNLI
jgi:flavin reductase (DIM6/NTAB) family NADH-FMN oxidoreductase RutF